MQISVARSFLCLLVVASSAVYSLRGAEAEHRETANHPLVGTWTLEKGRRPNGQIQFQGDIYFKTIVFQKNGKVLLERDIGTSTSGTWRYDEEAELILLKYTGGHTGAGFPADKSVQFSSHVRIEGDRMTILDVGGQPMTYGKTTGKISDRKR